MITEHYCPLNSLSGRFKDNIGLEEETNEEYTLTVGDDTVGDYFCKVAYTDGCLVTAAEFIARTIKVEMAAGEVVSPGNSIVEIGDRHEIKYTFPYGAHTFSPDYVWSFEDEVRVNFYF